MKTTVLMNKRVKKAAVLVCLIVAFMVFCLTGCVGGETAQKSEPVTLEATATQTELQEKLSDETVSGVILSGDISLTEPLQIVGSKTISGAGTISAAEGFTGDYLIAVPANAELLLGGDVVVDAAGVAGGVHVASDAVLTVQDQAAVKNASADAANLLVEGFLDMLGGSLSGAQGHNIHNVGEANIVGGEISGSGSGFAGIYNEGTLSQNGGVVTGGYNNIVSAEGSEFTWNDGSNENAVNNGMVIAPKAELTVTARSAKLTGAGNLGIELQGTAVIDDITLNDCFNTLIKVASTGKLTLNGGMIFNGSLHGVDNDGVMVMNGGDIMSCADSGIVNTGTLEVKAGGISDNGNKGILNKLEGKATVIGADITISGNRFAIGNEDKAYFELAKATIMGSTTSNIYALDGEMYIHDIELGASNSNNIRVVAADLTLKNAAVNGNASSGSNSMHGIILEGGSVHATDLIVRNTTGAGIRNKGGSFTGKNVTLDNNKYIGIYTSDQDVTGRPGTTVLENLTVSRQGYMSISSNGTGVLEITNGVLEATPSNNVRVNGGTVKLNKVEVKGHTEAATTAHHGIYLEGGQIIANNLTISDTKGHGLRNKSGDFTGTNVVIKNVNGEAAVSNVLLGDGTSGTITLNNVSFSNVKSKNIVNEAGTTIVNGSYLSAAPGSNIKISGGAVSLNNVTVAGNIPGFTGTLHAIIIENGYGVLNMNTVTITDAKNSGIRNKTGVINGTDVTIKDCGASAISNGQDTTRGLKGTVKIAGLTVEDCGNNNIVVDAGEVHISDAKLGPTESNNVKTSGTGVITLTDTVVNGSTGSYGVIAEGGSIQLTNVTIKNTKTAGIRVNQPTGSVTGTNVTIENTGTHAIYVHHGSVEIKNLTTKDIGTRNIEVGASAYTDDDGSKVDATGGTVKIIGGKLCKTENQHSVAVYGENAGTVVELSNVTLNGSGNGGGSRHVILAEGGNVKLTDVTIKDANNAAIRVNRDASTVEAENLTIQGGTTGISASAGTVTVKNLKSSASSRNIAAEGATIVIDGAELGKTETHNIKINKGSLTLKNATLAGSSNRGIMIEPGASDGQPTLDLTNVKISSTKESAIENRGGIVTAKDLTITDSKAAAIQTYAHKDGKSVGSVTVTNYTVSDSYRSINSESGNVTVNGGTLGVTPGHNVKTTSGKVSLTDVTIEGTSKDSGVMAEGGNVELTNVTIKNTAGSGVRINRAASTVTATNLTVQGAKDGGIFASAGTVNVTTYTASGNNRNIDVSGATVAVTDADLGTTTTHNIKISKGSLTLEDAALAGSSDRGVMIEPGKSDGQPVVELTDVKISNTKSCAIENRGGAVKAENLTITGSKGNAIQNQAHADGKTAPAVSVTNYIVSDSIRSINSEAGTVTVKGGNFGVTSGHNIKTTSGTVTLADVTINGTTKDNGIMAEGGDVVLSNVTIKNVTGSGIRINKSASSVEGVDVTIEGAAYGISGTAGTVTVSGLTSTASVHNVLAEGASITVNGGTLNATGANNGAAPHNVKTTSGSVVLTDVVLNGVTDTSAHVLMAEGGDMTLTDVTVKGAKNAALRVNKAASEVNATKLTIEGAVNGVYVSDGKVTITGLTSSASRRNIEINGGALAVTSGTLATTSAHNVKVVAGSLSLKQVSIAGSSDRGIMVEPEDGVQPAVTLESVDISNTTSYALDNKGGIVTAESLDVTNCARSINNDAGTVTVTGGTFGSTPGHNVKAASGTVKLTGVTINGTTKDNGIMAEGGNIELVNVTIKDSSNAAIRINKAASSVEAENLTIQGGNVGISASDGTVTGTKVTVQNAVNGVVVSGGTVNIDVLNSSASNRNIEVSGGTVTVTGGEFGSTPGHNVKATGGTVNLSGITINGTTKDNGIMAEGGDFVLTDMIINGAAGNAIRANKSESVVTINGLTVQGCAGAISVDKASVTADNVTANTTGMTVYAGSGELTISNATLTTTGTSNVIEHIGGTLNLQNVTAATIKNSAANLNISGKIVGSITNDKAVAVNVTGALTTDSAITIDWTEGNAPTGTAISFAAGTMEAGQNCFTLGAVQSQINELVYENNTGRLESLFDYVAQVGETKYEDLNEAIAALDQLTGDQTLIILADCGEDTTIEIPDNVNLTIQGGDHVARLGATVKVDKDDTLNIGKNVTFDNVEVIVEGTPYEEALTLAEGHSVTADMFSLKTESGVAYGAMIENNKVMVYTKEASDEASMLAAVNGAPDNKCGYIIVTGDVTLSDTLTFPANKILTVMDDGKAVRTISRSNAAVDMINIETGADITIKSSDDSSVKLVLDGKNVGDNGKAMVRVVGGTANIQNVNIVNANKNYNLFCSSGVLNVTSAELGTNLDVSSVYVTGGKVSLTDVEVKDAGSNSIRAQGGEIALHDVTVNGHTRTDTLHNIMIDGGKVTATGTLTLKDSKNSGIRITSGSFTGETVKIQNASTHAVWAGGGTVTIDTLNIDTTKNHAIFTQGGTVTVTTGGSIKNITRAVQVSSGTVSLTGMTIEKNTSSHNIKVENGGLNLSGVTIKGSASRAIMVEPGTKDYHPNVTLHNVTIEDADSHGLQNKGGIVTATGTLTINNTDYAILNAAHNNEEMEDRSGSVTIATLNATGNNRTIDSSIGTVTVNGGEFGSTNGHNVKTTAGTIKLTDVTINGTTKDNGIMAEGGDFVLTGVTIKDTVGRAIWMNKSDSEVKATNLTITGCAKGVGASNGVMTVDTLTAQTTGYGVEATNGTITIKNATLTNNGSDPVVYHTGGTLNLENVTAATIYNSAANLNISGKIVGSITNDAAVAVNVTSALTTDSAITIDWAAGNAPAGTAISFAEGTMDASKGYFTLGAIQSVDYKLDYANNAATLVSNRNYVAQVGETKYESVAEAVAALNSTNNTLTILASTTEAVVVPEGMNLTIQGSDEVVALNATVQVGAGETLTIGENIKIAKVDATAGGSIVYAGNTATAESPLTVIVKGEPYEVAVTLAEGNTATADMFSLVDAAGNAYGSLIEDGKVKVYTKDVTDTTTLQAAITGAPVNAKGFIILKDNITLSSAITINNGIDLTVLDDGSKRNITRESGNTFPFITVNEGGKLTVTGTAANYITLDGLKLNQMITVNGGDVVLTNVDLQNASTGGSFLVNFKGGTFTATNGTFDLALTAVNMPTGLSESDVVTLNNVKLSNPTTNALYIASGTANLNNVTMTGSGSNTINAAGGTVNLNGTTTITEPGSESSHHGIYINGGTVNSTGTLNVTANKGSAVRISSNTAGSFTAETANLTAPSGYAVNMDAGSFTVTKGGTIKGTRSFQLGINGDASSATVSLTGVKLEKSAGGQHNIKAARGTITLTNVKILGAGNHGIILEGGTPKLILNNVDIQDVAGTGIRNRKGVVEGTDLTIDGAALGLYNEMSSCKIDIDGLTILNATTDVEIDGGQVELSNVSSDMIVDGGTLIVSGKVESAITINNGSALSVSGALSSGSAVTIDWATAPADTAISFTDEAAMTASKGYFTLGAVQGATKYLKFADNKAILADIAVVTDESGLTTALADTNVEVIKLGGSIDVASSLTLAADREVLIQGAGNTITYNGAKDSSLVTIGENAKLTVQNAILDCGGDGTVQVGAKQTLVLDGCTVQNSTSNTNRSVDVIGGNLVIKGNLNITNTNWALCVRETGSITSETGSTVTISSASYGAVAHGNSQMALKKLVATGVSNSSVYVDNDSVVTIDEASITGGKYGVEMPKGSTKTASLTMGKTAITGTSNNALNIRCGTFIGTNLQITNCKTAVCGWDSSKKIEITGLTVSGCGENVAFQSGDLILNNADLGVATTSGIGLYGTTTSTLSNITGAGADIWLMKGYTPTLNVSGKIVSKITIQTGAALNVTGALTSDSEVTVEWTEVSAPAGTAIQFANAEVLAASKDRITLGETQAASYELSFGETTATLVAKQ